MSDAPHKKFEDFELSEKVLKALKGLGYEQPTPIQSLSIPEVLAGHDIIGQAQTGTGKTAAFALPILSQINTKKKTPQCLVLAPTRELAIQVSEAFQAYAKYLPGFHVTPIYGGQSYPVQLKSLKRGTQVVVGTPGRVMDHIRKNTLILENISTLVLDEADEMLRMGFIDDVEWILDRTPKTRQIALFSATMPAEIKKVAKKHLQDPKTLSINVKTRSADTVKQRKIEVNNSHKLNVLTRILDNEEYDGVIIFARTKNSTVELSDKLIARGYKANCLNGDIEQKKRETIVEKLKKGQIDILVATDVAARGLDVKRISHVINYDIPYDTEAYIHRIGRTGRAGRTGEAILFVGPREGRMLRMIEKATGKSIDNYELPSADKITQNRVVKFMKEIDSILDSKDLTFYEQVILKYQQEQDCDPTRIAAALAFKAQGNTPLQAQELEKRKKDKKKPENKSKDKGKSKEFKKTAAKPLNEYPDVEMNRYVLTVGKNHDVKPGNIIGAIANEAEIEGKYIGQIEIYDDISTIDLPDGMPDEIFYYLQNTRVCGQKLNIQLIDNYEPGAKKSTTTPPKRKEKTKKKVKGAKSSKKRSSPKKKSNAKINSKKSAKRKNSRSSKK